MTKFHSRQKSYEMGIKDGHADGAAGLVFKDLSRYSGEYYKGYLEGYSLHSKPHTIAGDFRAFGFVYRVDADDRPCEFPEEDTRGRMRDLSF